MRCQWASPLPPFIPVFLLRSSTMVSLPCCQLNDTSDNHTSSGDTQQSLYGLFLLTIRVKEEGSWHRRVLDKVRALKTRIPQPCRFPSSSLNSQIFGVKPLYTPSFVRPPNVLLRDMTANPVPLVNRIAAPCLLSLMEILRVSLSILPYFLPHACFQENRLAQLSTVDQRRELMRCIYCEAQMSGRTRCFMIGDPKLIYEVYEHRDKARVLR
jgi:hypothetical protein